MATSEITSQNTPETIKPRPNLLGITMVTSALIWLAGTTLANATLEECKAAAIAQTNLDLFMSNIQAPQQNKKDGFAIFRFLYKNNRNTGNEVKVEGFDGIPVTEGGLVAQVTDRTAVVNQTFGWREQKIL